MTRPLHILVALTLTAGAASPSHAQAVKGSATKTITTSAQSARGSVIQGTVRDAATGEPVTGASIKVQGDKGGTLTDIDGHFTIKAKQLPATLVVNFVGYRKLTYDVYDTDEPLTIDLTEDHVAINEVVVLGYGTQNRKQLTGSVAKLKPQEQLKTATSVNDVLGGAVSGLNISQSSGQPGAASSVRIRGGNSITGGNEPLYVIDGVLVYNNDDATQTGVGRSASTFDPLATVNPSDIESIEVLKDVSATAIYGSRGANGVIIVTTKQGKAGKPHIEYGYSVGVSALHKKLSLLDARQWGELYLEIATDAQKKATGVTPEVVSAWGKGYDWQDAYFHTAVTQQHQLSVSGGSDKEHYLLSANYTDQDGIVRGTDFTRYGARLNYSRDLFSNFTVGTTVNVSKSAQNGLSTFQNTVNGLSGQLEQALRTSPAVPIRDENGAWNYANPFEAGDLVKSGGITPNAIAEQQTVTSLTKVNTFLGTLSATYKPVKGLTLKVQGSSHIIHTNQDFYSPSSATVGFFSNGYGSVGSKTWESDQLEATANYRKVLGEVHELEVLGGFTTQTTKSESVVAAAADFANDNLGYHSLQSGAQRVAPVTESVKSTLNSFIGRVNYTLLGRYNLTATLRADGSSRFADNHKWGYFPSIGASWNISDEPFLKAARHSLGSLKLRASYGTVGNQEIGDYQFLSKYASTLGYYYFNGTLATGYYRSSLANADLKWETTCSFNVGVDWSLLGGRLAITADYYVKKTSDLLVDIAVEQTTGFSSQLRNVGNVSNSGIELSVNATPIQRKRLTWTVYANAAHNKNKVTSLGGGQTQIINSNQTIIRVGEPLGSFYGWVFDGLVQKGQELSKVPVPVTKTNVEYGDAKFVDQNHDGQIDQEGDRVVLGNTQPKLVYGFGSSLRVRRFDISFQFQGSYGNKLYNRLRQSLETPSTSYNVSTALLDRWTEDHTETLVPKATAKVSYTSYLDSRYVESASYLRLKNLQVGYTLPVRLALRQKLTVNIYASAQNLITFTPYKGYDPEFSGAVDNGIYPSARSFLFGVKIAY